MKEHRLTKLMLMAGKPTVLICTSLGISLRVAKPLNRSEAKGDLVMIKMLLLYKYILLYYHAS